MPTTQKRINAVLEPSLYHEVERMAHQEGVSLSQKVRDLVREALDLVEEAGWDKLVAERRHRKGRWLTDAETWGKKGA